MTSDKLQCDEQVAARDEHADGAASWAGSFEKLLDDPIALQVFAEFLKKEFSAENIYFWTACQRYRRLAAGPERAAEAQRIHSRHLCVGAPEPVNVDSQGRQFSQQALQDADAALFEQAQKQIFNLMKFDSYPRFLKSELYKQCLSGTAECPQLEAGLMLQPGQPKLKKSLSNAEDRRRKSLLPWHRKNRSKSKDRGETEYQRQRRRDDEPPPPRRHQHQQHQQRRPAHSSQSSLTSLDLAMSCAHQQPQPQPQPAAPAPAAAAEEPAARGALCRVILPGGATTVVQVRPAESIRELASRLLDKRGLAYSAYEVYWPDQGKPLDPAGPAAALVGREVLVEQRVVFKLDLPNRKVISVKSKTSKVLVDVLRPILHKYGYGADIVRVSANVNDRCELVDIALPVTSVDGRRLVVQLYQQPLPQPQGAPPPAASTPSSSSPSSLDEITNKVFEQLLHEKSADAAAQQAAAGAGDRASVKSEDWGSEHSSGIFGKFLRRDSAAHDRRKKLHAARGGKAAAAAAAGSAHGSAEDVAAEPGARRPLIAKLRAGVRLQTACSESDELYEGLKRAQRSRLEDQRGTEINFELPDFLKDKDGCRPTARFYDAAPADGDAPSAEPPPLPPKPKVLPIKPSNWGQQAAAAAAAALKAPREPGAARTLYLEQPSSSFV